MRHVEVDDGCHERVTTEEVVATHVAAEDGEPRGAPQQHHSLEDLRYSGGLWSAFHSVSGARQHVGPDTDTPDEETDRLNCQTSSG